MTAKLLILLTSFLLFFYQKRSDDYNYCKLKAKQTADSIIYSLVDKHKFKNFYRLSKDNSSIIERGSYTETPWKKTIYIIPTKYTLTYVPKNSSLLIDELTIELDENYKLKTKIQLVDNKYLTNEYLSEKNVTSIVKKLSFKNISNIILVYDSIPNKRTYKPLAEVWTYVNSYQDTCQDCSVIIDSCYKIDIGSRKIINRYKRMIRMIGQS